MFYDPDGLRHAVIVGSLAYIALILILRLSGKRTLSKWNAFDFVVTVAFGSVLATTVMSTDASLSQGVLGLGLLVGWQFLLTWLSVHVTAIQRLIKGEPALLLYHGEFRQKTMRQERVTEGEIRAAVRSNGMADLEDVAAVVLETDGTFSVIKKVGDNNRRHSALQDVRGY